MLETVEQAKQEFLRTKARLERLFEETPEDRINWSPSPSARTPVRLVAHSAMAIGYITQQMSGQPFDLTLEAADRHFREYEAGFSTRDQALSALNESSDKLLNLYESLTPERLDQVAQLPFGLGHMPVSMWLTVPARHTESHIAQLEYIQSIYGDLDWHL
jgi:hypothetical protein